MIACSSVTFSGGRRGDTSTDVSFESESEKVTTHLMRKIYACMVYNSLSDRKTVDELTYVANILGHDLKRLTLATTLPYLCVRLV